MTFLYKRALVKTIENKDYTIWLFYDHGNYHKPLLVLDEAEMAELLKDYKDHLAEKAQDG